MWQQVEVSRLMLEDILNNIINKEYPNYKQQDQLFPLVSKRMF